MLPEYFGYVSVSASDNRPQSLPSAFFPYEAPAAPEKSEDDIFVEEILEKPISQWNKEEVKRFAAIKEIDISGTKNANEAKEIIKSFIDGE